MIPLEKMDAPDVWMELDWPRFIKKMRIVRTPIWSERCVEIYLIHSETKMESRRQRVSSRTACMDEDHEMLALIVRLSIELETEVNVYKRMGEL